MSPGSEGIRPGDPRMNAATDYRSLEIERLRAAVACLNEQNAGLREELREAHKMPIFDAPSAFLFGILLTVHVLAALA